MDFGRLNVVIGLKMANGQLLFLALFQWSKLPTYRTYPLVVYAMLQSHSTSGNSVLAVSAFQWVTVTTGSLNNKIPVSSCQFFTAVITTSGEVISYKRLKGIIIWPFLTARSAVARQYVERWSYLLGSHYYNFAHNNKQSGYTSHWIRTNKNVEVRLPSFLQGDILGAVSLAAESRLSW